MSYSAGEALILTQIRALTNYGTTNSSRKNWRPLNQGRSNKYAFLRRGSFTVDWHGLGGNRQTTWQTIVEVWVRYKDDGTDAITLDDEIQTIRNRIDSYRLLADTTGKIVDSTVRSGDEPQEMWIAGGNGPSWLKAELTIEWIEQEAITLNE